MPKTLLVLAAGMGSRYGGLKQIDPVGPGGETLMDYSVYDALRAGFDKVVFVIRRDIEQSFKEKIGRRYEQRVRVEYVYQELNSLPGGFTVPADRKKPWGTGHAILVAAPSIREPFAAINADDFYGAESFRLLGRHLQLTNSDYAMVGFVLRNTLSEFGSVARGVCRLGPEPASLEAFAGSVPRGFFKVSSSSLASNVTAPPQNTPIPPGPYIRSQATRSFP
jgi:UTP-glucose-1-phosphate uridylyltransferase